MSIVFTLTLAMLGVAALLLLARMTIGPTMLDRTVAFDVLIAITICGIAIEAAINDHTYTLPILLVLTLVAFVGSVSIARYVRGSADIDAEAEQGERR
ncbi:cation:proton antiporter [Nocardioides sp. BGMRC 2183]|nr:cation:proton antiporter [Nocardioides sp. BGMRC 2183]